MTRARSCNWRAAEVGAADGMLYRILRCKTCGAETAQVEGHETRFPPCPMKQLQEQTANEVR